MPSNAGSGRRAVRAMQGVDAGAGVVRGVRACHESSSTINCAVPDMCLHQNGQLCSVTTSHLEVGSNLAPVTKRPVGIMNWRDRGTDKSVQLTAWKIAGDPSRALSI